MSNVATAGTEDLCYTGAEGPMRLRAFQQPFALDSLFVLGGCGRGRRICTLVTRRFRLTRYTASVRKGFLLLFAIALQLVLYSCSNKPAFYTHTFSFDLFFDALKFNEPDEEVLDYQYGDSGEYGTRAYEEGAEHGGVFMQHSVYQAMPRGEFLYVKWRVKSTGETSEDRADLRRLLPSDLTHYGIHFVVRGSQLYVYLVKPPGIWDAREARKSQNYLVEHQIYPVNSHTRAYPSSSRRSRS